MPNYEFWMMNDSVPKSPHSAVKNWHFKSPHIKRTMTLITILTV